MKITIFYKKKNKTQIRMIENVLIPWSDLAQYKIDHPDRSDEVVMDELAKLFLYTLRGKNVDYMGWQEDKS